MSKNCDQINLSHPEDSKIPVEIIRFPDGQQSVTIGSRPERDCVEISARIRDFSDLELVLGCSASLREMGMKTIHLFVPYFCGARSDRKFVFGGNNYLRDVICPVVNSAGFETVTVLDPHSDVLEACLKNFRRADNRDLVGFALGGEGQAVTLVSPDAGASKKVWKMAELFGIGNVVTAEKARDVATGKILRTEIHGVEPTDADMSYMIIDDICDGGRTFTALAQTIRNKRAGGVGRTRISLVVTHGIFSAGLKPFEGVIDCIYTTNSYRDIPGEGAWARENADLSHGVKTKNVI